MYVLINDLKPYLTHFSATLLNIQVDKNDLGAFRFNDPERNDVMIASTDLQGLSKSPMVYDSSAPQNLRRGKEKEVKQNPHYSTTSWGMHTLWGIHNVYADDLVDDETVSLSISHV